jgi:hypothetical protein
MTYALRLAILALLFCSPFRVEASEDVQTGTIMICDTQKQVERFVTFFNFAGNAQSAIRAVNTEAENPSACAVGTIAYVRGEKIGMARTQTDAFQIVQILVVAVGTPAGMRPVAPAAFYTLVKVKEFAV